MCCEHLLGARRCFKIYPINLVVKVLSFLINQWENWGSNKLDKFPPTSQLVSDESVVDTLVCSILKNSQPILLQEMQLMFFF